MLGTLRVLLAVLVVLNHTWLPTANRFGAHAVIAFYVISGFLMTKIVHEVYGLSAQGAARYLTNRFLRIFVPYWFVIGIAALVLALWPAASFGRMALPVSGADALRNVTLIDVTWLPQALIPPAWSLSVECFFYIAMVALFARNRGTAFAWLVASIAIAAYLIATGAEFAERYYPLHAASLFFSIGAVTYFVLPRVASLAPPAAATAALVAIYCVWPLIVGALGVDPLMLGYYGAMAIFLPAFVGLLTLKRSRITGLDRFLGDLAYPVFLTHFLAAGIVKAAFPAIAVMGNMFVLLTLALTLALSVVSAQVLDRTVERLRARVRRKNWPATAGVVPV
jgi:peptidoglycan/LPS O-acetylase OafA/YrhL